MANFSYYIITKEGKEKKGTLEADSKEKAMAQLKAEGSTVVSVESASLLSKNITFGGGKAKPKDLSVFCRQFNSLLRAGVSIISALDMLAEQTENKALQTATYNVRDNVQKGESLASAMKRESVYPSLLVNMIEAGEASGNIENSLERMAVQFEKDTKVKALVKKAMIYPIILMFVAVAVLIVMVVAVIPQFAEMFEDMGTDLPGITKALMSLSASIKGNWYVYIGVIALLVVGVNFLKRSSSVQHLMAGLALKIPVFGNLTLKTASARFARTFSTMLSSGMPMVEAMNITAKTMDNLLFKESLEEAALGIQRGQSLNTILKKADLFPALIIHMVGIGEESGNLEEMLDNCAKYYDEEVEMATQQIMSLLEPMIIIVLAGIVVLVLAAIYGPMITLYDSLGTM